MRRFASVTVGVVIGVVASASVVAASDGFTDVPDSSPFHDDVAWLVGAGVTNGYADGTYRPSNPVSRAAMAAFMRRLAGADPAVDPMVNAALLDGRTPADYDNAVTLNGRTPADYDNAVTLNGRTPADYDNAVTLDGRTPADYDDAVTLDGRTPADYDDAVTLQGLGPDELLPEASGEEWLSPLPITGTSPATATTVLVAATPGPPGSVRMVTVHLLVNTNHDSALLSCIDGTGSTIDLLDQVKIGDAALGYVDRLPISVTRITNQDQFELACYVTDAVGGSVLQLENRSAYSFTIR